MKNTPLHRGHCISVSWSFSDARTLQRGQTPYRDPQLVGISTASYGRVTTDHSRGRTVCTWTADRGTLYVCRFTSSKAASASQTNDFVPGSATHSHIHIPYDSSPRPYFHRRPSPGSYREWKASRRRQAGAIRPRRSDIATVSAGAARPRRSDPPRRSRLVRRSAPDRRSGNVAVTNRRRSPSPAPIAGVPEARPPAPPPPRPPDGTRPAIPSHPRSHESA